MPTAVSLFSGCGGFDWGAQQAGVDIIWANDVDPRAVSAYQSVFPNVPVVLDDIANINEFPQADIIIGCYPCTGFSLAARRRARGQNQRDLIQNETNFLYKQYLRAVREINPRYIFIENVRGMISANNGWFLNQQLEAFNSLGYTITYKLLDASDFGVAQTRKRIFLVGVRNDVGFDYAFPEPTHGVGKHPIQTLADVVNQPFENDDICEYPFHGHYLTRNRKRDWNKPSYTIVADSHHVPLHPSGEPMRYLYKDTWTLQGDINRRLSWKECRAIQGLPDHMEVDGPLSAKYRVVGNAVPPTFGNILVQPVVAFEQGQMSTQA
ncbi:DNA (cytosine-5-)-methyltransferase [Herpetosiphon gulosus]|uniref:Cytosine-specific methyltransferase n=1 Tax=Herpetosiphon gulosus TaxID=1973496 RepID=A0ABP9X6Z9_9CHLR